MKYIKLLLVVFVVLASVLTFSYFYFVPKKPNTSDISDDNKERPIETPRLRTNEIFDYTTLETKDSDGPVLIRGFFQVIELEEKTIGNITYQYVMGILGKDESISRIWLTSEEYVKVSETTSGLYSGTYILVKLDKGSIGIERINLN